MKYFIKPLSKECVQILQECWEEENNENAKRLPVWEPNHYLLEPLYESGLLKVEIKIIEGKDAPYLALTVAGIDFLKNMEADKRKAFLLDALTKPELKN